MSDIVSMTQELIASIQTSADGVTTETVSMQRAMVVRRERLNEHIASVPARLMTGVRDTQRTRQWHRSHEEATEIAPPGLVVSQGKPPPNHAHGL
eukprot:572295-Amphidinium_carterae.1